MTRHLASSTLDCHRERLLLGTGRSLERLCYCILVLWTLGCFVFAYMMQGAVALFAKERWQYFRKGKMLSPKAGILSQTLSVHYLSR